MTTTTTTTTTNPHEAAERAAETRRTREAREASRVLSLSRDLRTAVRILDSSVRDLRVLDYGPAPAWTDFEGLYLNRSMLPRTVGTPREVAVWAGAAYHELGHVVFSPRPGSTLFGHLDRVRGSNPTVFRTLNLAEDQRQERAMVSRFSPLRGYYSALVVSLILSGSDASASWPLVTGRTYLPAEARRVSRAAWVADHGEASAAMIADLVGEFQSLSDPAEADSERAASLVLSLDRVLRSAGTPSAGCSAPEGDRPGSSVPTPETDTPTAADADPEVSGDEDGEGVSGEGEDGDEAGEAGDEAGDGETGEAGDETGEAGEGTGEAGDETGDGETGDETGDTPGTGNEDTDGDSPEGDGESSGGTSAGTSEASPEAGSGPSAEDVRDALSDAVSEVLAAPDVREDLRDLVSAAEAGGDVPANRGGQGTNRVIPSPEAVSARESITETLRDLRSKAEAAWERGTDSGRVNVGRFADPGRVYVDPSTVFDRFSPDSLEAVSTELVVLVDLSGSMRHHENELSEAVWAVHHAADSAEARLTVLGFSSGPPVLLVSPDDRPGDRVPVLRADGGTEVAPSLGVAWSTFRGSEAGHRVLVVLSDGSWADPDESSAIIRGMREDGVSVSSVLFSGSDVSPDTLRARTYGADRAVHVRTLADFASLVSETVNHAMRDGLRMI